MININIGCVCKCQKNIVGMVTSYTYTENHITCKGITLEGKQWQSKNPEFIAKNLKEYFIHRRFYWNFCVKLYHG